MAQEARRWPKGTTGKDTYRATQPVCQAVSPPTSKRPGRTCWRSPPSPLKEIWRQIWSNNPQERLNREIRRRTDVVGIFPDRISLIRLVGAGLAEQNDEWIEGRRYLGLDVLARSRITPVPTTDPTEVTTDNDLQALTA
jgi:Transposase, Mutator family